MLVETPTIWPQSVRCYLMQKLVNEITCLTVQWLQPMWWWNPHRKISHKEAFLKARFLTLVSLRRKIWDKLRHFSLMCKWLHNFKLTTLVMEEVMEEEEATIITSLNVNSVENLDTWWTYVSSDSMFISRQWHPYQHIWVWIWKTRVMKKPNQILQC